MKLINKKGISMITLIRTLYGFISKLNNETKTVLLMVIFIIYFNIDIKKSMEDMIYNHSGNIGTSIYNVNHRFIPKDNDLLGKKAFSLLHNNSGIRQVMVFIYDDDSNGSKGYVNIYFKNIEFSDKMFFNSYPLYGLRGNKGLVITLYNENNNITLDKKRESINIVKEMSDIIEK